MSPNVPPRTTHHRFSDPVTAPRVWDPDWITRREAAAFLGISENKLDRLLRDGQLTQADRPVRRLSRAEVEAWATESEEWINARQAAEILGVCKARVGQLADKGFLPYDRGTNGRRRYKRSQIEVIANARRTRWNTKV